jgi:hypothetical protein
MLRLTEEWTRRHITVLHAAGRLNHKLIISPPHELQLIISRLPGIGCCAASTIVGST